LEVLPRKRADRSYSVLLRPDVVLRIHRGPDHEDHLFDAKFKVRRIAGEVEDRQEEDRGVFKREDVYKMHAYRDALPSVRSAWVLYPGTELRFYSAEGTDVADASFREGGVGAVPLLPGVQLDVVADLVALDFGGLSFALSAPVLL